MSASRIRISLEACAEMQLSALFNYQRKRFPLLAPKPRTPKKDRLNKSGAPILIVLLALEEWNASSCRNTGVVSQLHSKQHASLRVSATIGAF